MKGYILAEIEVTDPEIYKQYMPLAAAAISAFGGRYLARGGAVATLEGESPPRRTVLLEFASPEKAKAFFASPQYQEAAAIRRRSARGRVLLLEGCQPP